MAKLKINPQRLAQVRKKIDEAFGTVVAKLDSEFKAVIEDPNEFGDLGLENQDIVDTGRLRDSQTVTVEQESPTRKVVRWKWDPVSPDNGRHYAGDVLVGFNAFGRKWIPGRNWPERAVKRVDPVQVFEDELKS